MRRTQHESVLSIATGFKFGLDLKYGISFHPLPFFVTSHTSNLTNMTLRDSIDHKLF